MTEHDVDILSPRSFSLWYAVGGPPLIWGAQVAIGDLIFELGCGPAIRGQGFLLLSLKAWAIILTAVVFPFVPVTETTGIRAWVPGG